MFVFLVCVVCVFFSTFTFYVLLQFMLLSLKKRKTHGTSSAVPVKSFQLVVGIKKTACYFVSVFFLQQVSAAFMSLYQLVIVSKYFFPFSSVCLYIILSSTQDSSHEYCYQH